MSKKDDFFSHISDGYASKGDFIILGGAMLDGMSVVKVLTSATFIRGGMGILNRAMK